MLNELLLDDCEDDSKPGETAWMMKPDESENKGDGANHEIEEPSTLDNYGNDDRI
jgi:hypothetical protein